MSKLDGFDPNGNTRTPTKPEWATYIPERWRKPFKIHTNRGHALNAISYGSYIKDAILYKLVNDEWVEVFRIENYNPKQCENCHGTKVSWGLYRVWINLKDDVPELRTVCRDCERELRR